MPSMTTFHGIAQIERLSRALEDILRDEFGRPLPLGVCCATIAGGLGLRGRVDHLPGLYVGSPWSSTAALYHLAGKGYLFDPRIALAAIQTLEGRHILDRRKNEYREPQRLFRPAVDRGRTSFVRQRDVPSSIPQPAPRATPGARARPILSVSASRG